MRIEDNGGRGEDSLDGPVTSDQGSQGQKLEPGASVGAGHLEDVMAVHGGGVGNDALVPSKLVHSYLSKLITI